MYHRKGRSMTLRLMMPKCPKEMNHVWMTIVQPKQGEHRSGEKIPGEVVQPLETQALIVAGAMSPGAEGSPDVMTEDKGQSTELESTDKVQTPQVRTHRASQIEKGKVVGQKIVINNGGVTVSTIVPSSVSLCAIHTDSTIVIVTITNIEASTVTAKSPTSIHAQITYELSSQASMQTVVPALKENVIRKVEGSESGECVFSLGIRIDLATSIENERPLDDVCHPYLNSSWNGLLVVYSGRAINDKEKRI
ncbi:hypothetical protein H6P81_016489 [Aristolochia fimbriata]|uniref:Uncharacterized protein n=1 Tax=Aristolochia fimbriata TaxID=158543 RepID=A0AAV7EA45_ARIFI|nr:hypothetical protein H6P81_016489 [Aristolochia fimbriata]